MMASNLGETKESAEIRDRHGVLARTPAHGGLLRRGNPMAGRQQSEFRQKLRDILAKPEVEAALVAVLTDPANRNFASLWKHVAERAFGPVVQRVKLKGQHEVRGVILLPQASWGGAPQPQAPAGAPALAASQPEPVPAAALPLSPELLDTLAAAVANVVTTAATDPDDDPEDGQP